MTGTEAIIAAIKAIPRGKVATYSGIAALAGIPNGARQVARVLHTCSEKHSLPWWRIVRNSGEIALPDEAGGALQLDLLLREKVLFSAPRVVDLNACGYTENAAKS